MSSKSDEDFGTALFRALMREAGRLAGRGITRLSSQSQVLAREMDQFVLVRCQPFSAHLYIVHPDGTPHEYYRETEDQLSQSITDLAKEFLTSGMKELSVSERQDISRRVEANDLRLAVLIESTSSTIRALALGPDGALIGSDEIFQLVCAPN